MTTSVLWFRRDLRVADNPALLDAVAAGPDGVLPLFVLDPSLWGPAGVPRRSYLTASLGDLGRRIPLQIVEGDPVNEVVRVARAAGAASVHIAADFNPYGRRRDEAVEAALAEQHIELLRTGSSYAVAPGRVLKEDGTPFRVYTPFARAWSAHGWRAPATAASSVDWLETTGTVALPDVDAPEGTRLAQAGEARAQEKWQQFLDADVDDYADVRNLPGVDRTSRMSVHLKWGEIHPRTMLADLADRRSAGAAAYRREIAFREYYADTLWHNPHSARTYLNPGLDQMRFDEPGERFRAWCAGQTGYPIVDAGMRQLLAEGWMHNRLRMIVASFLIKDLHIEWQHGARHFMNRLVDGDLASNQHGWQWVAGSGTDPAPYFRIFNPVTQGQKFDPDGRYIHRFISELADIPAPDVHEPWKLPDDARNGYPLPIVDHKAERTESLARYQETR